MRTIAFIFALFSFFLAKAITFPSLFEYKWAQHPFNLFWRIGADSTNNQYSLRFEVVPAHKGTWCMLLPIYQLTGEENNFTVKVKYKSKDVQRFYITLNSIAGGACVTRRDTINLPASSKWSEATSQVRLKHADLLNVSLEAVGKIGAFGTIQLADFTILADSKKINNDAPDTAVAPLFKRTDLLSWDYGNYESLPCINSRILGVGETIHGTKTMGCIAMDVMKERILKHQCRMVMLELPMEYCFYINRYIKGDSRFKIAEILKYVDKTLLGEPLLSFIAWLKQYNATHDNAVSLMGFDINTSELQSSVDLFSFFYTLNNGKKDPDMAAFCKSLLTEMRPQNDGRNIAARLDSCNVARGYLQPDELALMRKCIQLIQRDKRNQNTFSLRDQNMATFSQFVIDSVLPKESTVTMYAHSLHLNYSTARGLHFLDYYSFGHEMKAKYGDEYHSIDIVTYKGSTVVSKDFNKLTGSELDSMPQRSLEYQLGELGVDKVYLPMNKLRSSQLLRMRIVGAGSVKNQFAYVYPAKRVDGVLFVRNVERLVKEDKVINAKKTPFDLFAGDYLEARKKMEVMLKE